MEGVGRGSWNESGAGGDDQLRVGCQTVRLGNQGRAEAATGRHRNGKERRRRPRGSKQTELQGRRMTRL